MRRSNRLNARLFDVRKRAENGYSGEIEGFLEFPRYSAWTWLLCPLCPLSLSPSPLVVYAGGDGRSEGGIKCRTVG